MLVASKSDNSSNIIRHDTNSGPKVGLLVRDWRRSRGLTQVELAEKASVSARHLSFVETGRTRASRGLIVRLAEALDIPGQQRVELLQSGGFTAPQSPTAAQSARFLANSSLPRLSSTLDYLLSNHEPFPAFAMTPTFSIVRANRAATNLFARIAQGSDRQDFAGALLNTSADGDAFVENKEEVAQYLLTRIHRAIQRSPNERQLRASFEDVRALTGNAKPLPDDQDMPILSLKIRIDDTVLSVFQTCLHYGDVSELGMRGLYLEHVFPEDAETELYFRNMAAEDGQLGG